MKATLMRAAGDVRVGEIPDSTIVEPTDAIVRVTRACICGSDLWPFNGGPNETDQRMGHEAIGVVEEIGDQVQAIKQGQLVIMPFISSDGSCVFCQEGLTSACVHRGFIGNGDGMDGAQAEAIRVPLADGTLFPIDVGEDDELMPSLLTLSDVMGTGHHAAVISEVAPGKTAAVVGDGAVGLCAVIAAKRLGAEQIILMGRHDDRIALGKAFGATDIVYERGEEAIERVRELTGGEGVPSVLECVGNWQSVETAIGITRPGGIVGRVGYPANDETMPASLTAFFDNVRIAGGPAPSRAYIEELLPDVLEGRIHPGEVFDRTVDLDGVPDGYRAMNDRESIKVMIKP